MTKKQPFLLRVLKNRKFQFFTGLMIVLFVLLNYVVLPWYVNHGGTLSVPDVAGLSFERAVQLLESAGLEPVRSDIRPDPLQPPGTVVGQNPEPNSVVKFGRRIYLTISGGEALVPVPSLRGRSTRDARFALERNGLRLGETEYASSNTYPENTVIDQSTVPESMVSRGTSINILVSRGRVREETIIPDIIGKSVGEAEKILIQNGLRMGNITYHTSANLLPNTVVDQFPRAGEPVPSDQSVDLFVVKAGKAPDEIPDPDRR